MVQPILSILMLIAVLVLPTMGRADHGARPAQTWPTLIWPVQAWPGGGSKNVAPWAQGPAMLVPQARRAGKYRGGRDHDRARDAVSAGKVLPLQQILRQIGGRHPGRLLDATLARNAQGNWVYHLKLLAPGNQVQRLQVDARSGRLLQGGRRR
ncbi:MAG: hypothetical protein H8E30_08600 [Alphaproteobacteria bacterium]|nr:hypothetical protein [Alphaproteobacteria bacterium]